MARAEPTPADRRAATGWLLLVIAAWLAAVLLIDPRGDYPTTDDWAYRFSVAELVEHGRLRYSDWTAANLVTHFAWGALFAKLFGLSYFALRLSTLTAALLSGLALHRLSLMAGLRPIVAALAVGVWLLNPLSLALSFGFMSDMLFCALSFGAILLLSIGERRGSRLCLVLGWALGLGALLSRQLGLAIPIGWAFGRLLSDRPRTIPQLALLAVPTIGFLVVQTLYEHWLRSHGLAPAAFGRQTAGIGALLRHPAELAHLLLAMVQKALLYLGFLAFPLLVALMPAWLRSLTARWRIVALAVALLIAAALGATLWHGKLIFPIWSNTLSYFGIGPDLDGALTPHAVLRTITVMAVLGGGFGAAMAGHGLGRILFARARPARFDGLAALVFTCLAILGMTSLVAMRFDRYFLPMLPLVLVLPAVATGGMPLRASERGVGLAAVALQALFALLAVHDFVAAKRLQADAYRQLAGRFGNDAVDGGWVLNGPTRLSHYATGTDGAELDPGFRPPLVVATGDAPRPGYVTTARLPVDRWLPWRRSSAPVQIERRAALR